MRHSKKNISILLVLAVFFGGLYLLFGKPGASGKKLSFSTFMKEAKSGNIKAVTIQGQRYQGTFLTGKPFHTIGPQGSEKLHQTLLGYKVKLHYKAQVRSSQWLQFLIALLPMLLLGGIAWLVLKKIKGQGYGEQYETDFQIFYPSARNRVTFSDVAGIDEAKEELKEVVLFLQDPRRFTQLGGRIPKGVLLMGSPGTGKTLWPEPSQAKPMSPSSVFQALLLWKCLWV